MTLRAYTDAFVHSWTAEILAQPPPIRPARHFTYPLMVPGEEDALSRGALHLEVKPANGGSFLATCALGFREPTLPSGLWSCPNPRNLLAVAGGYAYLLDSESPERVDFLSIRPVCAVLPAPEEKVLLLAGFHSVLALDSEGVRWQSERLSWEGLTLGEVRVGVLHGTGWNMFSDRDLPFRLDLKTGTHEGGGYSPR